MTQRRVGEFLRSSVESKDGQVEKWCGKSHKREIRAISGRFTVGGATPFKVSTRNWQAHVWLVWIRGRTGKGLDFEGVCVWLSERYLGFSLDDLARGCVSHYFHRLTKLGGLSDIEPAPHRRTQLYGFLRKYPTRQRI